MINLLPSFKTPQNCSTNSRQIQTFAGKKTFPTDVTKGTDSRARCLTGPVPFPTFLLLLVRAQIGTDRPAANARKKRRSCPVQRFSSRQTQLNESGRKCLFDDIGANVCLALDKLLLWHSLFAWIDVLVLIHTTTQGQDFFFDVRLLFRPKKHHSSGVLFWKSPGGYTLFVRIHRSELDLNTVLINNNRTEYHNLMYK